MITPGLANALYAWAVDNDDRIADIRATRDALVATMLGEQPSTTLTSGSLNGKNFTALVSLSREEKLTLFSNVLERLGEIEATPTVSYIDFSTLKR